MSASASMDPRRARETGRRRIGVGGKTPISSVHGPINIYLAAKTEVWAENPVEGYARVLPRRISNPLKDINVEIGVSKRLAPGKSMAKSASWSDFGGAAAASKVAAVDARVSAASKKVTAEVVVAEAGAARANKSAAEAPANTKAVATEARATRSRRRRLGRTRRRPRRPTRRRQRPKLLRRSLILFLFPLRSTSTCGRILRTGRRSELPSQESQSCSLSNNPAMNGSLVMASMLNGS